MLLFALLTTGQKKVRHSIINVSHVQEEIRPYTSKLPWYKASEQDLSIYKEFYKQNFGKWKVTEALLGQRCVFINHIFIKKCMVNHINLQIFEYAFR